MRYITNQKSEEIVGFQLRSGARNILVRSALHHALKLLSFSVETDPQ